MTSAPEEMDEQSPDSKAQVEDNRTYDEEEEPEMSSSEDTSDDDEEDSDFEESDDESSFDEMSVGVALELPKRETRGKKYTQLLGEELEKDQQFWGHNTWEEEAVDEDYNCSEGEEQYAYSTDSDFDDPETDKSDEEVDESYLKEKKTRKHGSYVDPALKRQQIAKRDIRRQNVTKSTPPERKIKSKEFATQGNEVLTDRSVRASTKIKTKAANEMERKRDLIKTEMSAGAAHKRQETKKKHLTQEQLMEMALKNEAANTRSLEKMKAWEDEKKYYEEIKKWNYKGNYDIWVCWNSLLSIVGKATEEGQEAPTIPSKHDVEKPLELYMFTSGKVPEYYEEAVASFNETKDALTQICAITGKPARYLDPLTKCYYSGSDAFNALRMCHADGIDRHVAAELDRLEDMIEELCYSD